MAMKQTSDPVQISSSLIQSGTDTFTQAQVNLTLNPLDNEVFVVTAVKIDLGPMNLDTSGGIYSPAYLASSVTTTQQTQVQDLGYSGCIATGIRRVIYALDAAAVPFGVVGFEDNSNDAPPAGMDYLAIVATNDFWIQIDSDRLLSTSFANVRVYGYRAKADAATYAALVQSEVLSA